jgi:hypothetical protein
MTIVQGDGKDGYATQAPYDRIIITASTPTIPHAWLKQLAPDGRIVGILQPRFAILGGLLQAQKNGNDLMKGKLLQTASFMELRPIEYSKRSIWLDFLAPTFASFPFNTQLFQPHFLRENHDFVFFLYYDLPDLYVFLKENAFFIYQEASPQGYVIVRQQPTYSIELRGDRSIACSLWDRLVRAYSLWDRLEQPTISQYLFEMDSKTQALSLQTPLGIVWPFGVWS